MLDAGCDDDVEVPRLDRRRGVERRLKRRAALSVDGRSTDGLGPPGDENGSASDVQGLLADLRHTPHLDVFDRTGLELQPTRKPVQNLRRELVRTDAGEGSTSPPDRRSNRIHDVRVSRHRTKA